MNKVDYFQYLFEMVMRSVAALPSPIQTASLAEGTTFWMADANNVYQQVAPEAIGALVTAYAVPVPIEVVGIVSEPGIGGF